MLLEILWMNHQPQSTGSWSMSRAVYRLLLSHRVEIPLRAASSDVQLPLW